MSHSLKQISAIFYRSPAGNEPVREWLLSLPLNDRKTVGGDIKTVEFGWPVGMPFCRSLGKNLWEVRSNLESRRIARGIFWIADDEMYMLHGFIKKTQSTPRSDIDLATFRRKDMTN